MHAAPNKTCAHCFVGLFTPVHALLGPERVADHAISGGQIAEALVELSGDPAEEIEFDRDPDRNTTLL